MQKHFGFNWLWVAVALLAAAGLSACSAQAEAGSAAIQVTDAWARSGMTGGTSAVYFVLENNSSDEDALVGAVCSAGMAELHMTKMSANGTMSMERQERVPLPKSEPVTFKPGGLHVMVMGLKSDLKPGDSVTVTLQFEKAGDMEMEVAVREP